jgi:3-oxoacyl-[acyl-carrier protein] reductase
MIDTCLQGRIVLVKGANHGIGAATARAFAAQGAKVAVHYLEKPADTDKDPIREILHQIPGREAAEALVTEIREAGGEAAAVPADLSVPDAVPGVLDRAEGVFGVVEVIVNNAAHCELPDNILEADPGVFDRHFAVNARAAVLLISEFARRFNRAKLKDGHVINISTDAAQAFATQISYGASKAALEAYTRSIAWELGPLGITVNAVAPGPVQTGYITPQLETVLLPNIPLRRIGRPEDIADAVIFLASRQARLITGQVIRVCGGHVL